MLDLNELARGQKYLGAGPRAVSDDGHLLAYTIDVTGYREFTLHVKDLRTGVVLADRIPRVGPIAWAADNATLFYGTEDAAKRPDRIYRHTLGADPKDDPLVYEEKDELYRVMVTRSRDKKLLFLRSRSSTTTEERTIPADKPDAPPTVILPREEGHEYYTDHREGQYYHPHQQGSARVPPRHRAGDRPAPGQLGRSDPRAPADDDPGRRAVQAAHRPVRHGRGSAVPGGPRPGRRPHAPRRLPRAGLFGCPRRQSRVRHDDHPLQLPVVRHPAPRSSTTTSPSGYRRSGSGPRFSADSTLPITLPSGSSPTAGDGTPIPIALVSRKTTPRRHRAALALRLRLVRDSDAGHVQRPNLSLLDRGVVYAIAQVRGGGDLGKAWHDAGKMERKRTTFSDFIACADHLVALGYTRRDKLVIRGGSAGGLLIGAVCNLRPGLCKAAVLEVPFVDVLNTMSDASLPLTIQEYLEWGNPNIKAEYDVIKTYSPYENIAAAAYPAMLVRDVAQRQPGPLLGGGQVRRPDARDPHGRESPLAQGQHGRRPRRGVGEVRRPEGAGLRLRVRARSGRHRPVESDRAKASPGLGQKTGRCSILTCIGTGNRRSLGTAAFS